MFQRTPEWDECRRGKATASQIATVMVKTAKGKYMAGRKTYMLQLLAERLTGQQKVFRKNASILHGEEMEEFAKGAYEAATGVEIEEVGFIDHPTINGFGCSPDGFAGKGLVECKCLDSDNHLKFLIYGEVDRQYIEQMNAQMLVTQRPWCDFISFDDRFPEHLRYKSVRFERDITQQLEMATEVSRFLIELDELEKSLMEQAA